MKKILLYGNYTFENRGDLAILHGLYHVLSTMDLDWEITISSDFTLHNKQVYPVISTVQNKVASIFSEPNKNLISKINYNYLDLWRMDSLVQNNWSGGQLPFFLKRFQEAVLFFKDYDAVIFVGGSYFIDLYGPYRFLALLLSLKINKPCFLAGHSIGPFSKNRRVREYAKKLFPLVNRIYIRDDVSMRHAQEIELPPNKLNLTADTAWLLPDFELSTRVQHFLDGINSPTIAVTVRDLNSFAERLNITQEEFEQNYVKLLNRLIAAGYSVVGLSMAIPVKGSSYTDDRLIAKKIRAKLDCPEAMYIIEDEINHLEIGAILSRCEMLIGTRLHSAILSMRYGTPAIVVYYEHKSQGILRKMGLEDYSCRIEDLNSEATWYVLQGILNNKKELIEKIRNAVKREQNLAHRMILEIVHEINHI